jgi:hypothetical protein
MEYYSHSITRTFRKREAMGTTERERLLQAKLPTDLVKALRIHALEQDTTLKDLLTRMVREYLEKQTAAAARPRPRRDK